MGAGFVWLDRSEWANPTVRGIQQCSKQSFQSHNPGVSEIPPLDFFFSTNLLQKILYFSVKKRDYSITSWPEFSVIIHWQNKPFRTRCERLNFFSQLVSNGITCITKLTQTVMPRSPVCMLFSGPLNPILHATPHTGLTQGKTLTTYSVIHFSHCLIPCWNFSARTERNWSVVLNTCNLTTMNREVPVLPWLLLTLLIIVGSVIMWPSSLWFHHPLKLLHFFLSSIVVLLRLQSNLVSDFRLIFRGFCAILRGLCAMFVLTFGGRVNSTLRPTQPLHIPQKSEKVVQQLRLELERLSLNTQRCDFSYVSASWNAWKRRWKRGRGGIMVTSWLSLWKHGGQVLGGLVMDYIMTCLLR